MLHRNPKSTIVKQDIRPGPFASVPSGVPARTVGPRAHALETESRDSPALAPAQAIARKRVGYLVVRRRLASR